MVSRSAFVNMPEVIDRKRRFYQQYQSQPLETVATSAPNGRDCGVDGSRAQWRTETWRNSAHRFVGNTQVTPPEVGLRVPDFGANESAMDLMSGGARRPGGSAPTGKDELSRRRDNSSFCMTDESLVARITNAQ